MADFIIWYSKDKSTIKYRQLFQEKSKSSYDYLELAEGSYRRMSQEEKAGLISIPFGAKPFSSSDLKSSGYTPSCTFDFEFNDRIIKAQNKSWRTNEYGIKKLIKLNRLLDVGSIPRFKQYYEDFPLQQTDNLWSDTQSSPNSIYVVQTNETVIQRCLLMTTDPGDLVLDPTCGSGTTAYVAEQWGRRWITVDTSRIALNIAKQRLMTAVFPFYKLYDEAGSDIRQGFVYKTVPHITLKSLANDEPPAIETLYDKPDEDKKKLRVSGPFTVETLQNFEPIPVDSALWAGNTEEASGFEETVKQHLLSAGIKNGRKNEQVVFVRVELLSHSYLHAEGFYHNEQGENKAYIHIGPKFGTVSKAAVNEAIKECRQRGDAQWLIVLGFSFESDIEGSSQTTSVGRFEVTKARMHDDLLQEGLKKKPGKSAASFVTIGEPDIALHREGTTATIEIQGLDIYDPIRDEVKARNVSDIAYWMVDDDYDGSNFVVKQVFFCGGDKDEFEKWRKGLASLAKDSTKKRVEKTLKIEIDDEAFDRLYGHRSHPISIKKPDQRIAVRVISQFGEETMKVLRV